mmetsp:Transcript_10083/g.32048  ORF Transcript_10083/g.32048 Transcript_10083/m.32048 type:complete len:236 (+) Transcript_10083:637-1344(+)
MVLRNLAGMIMSVSMLGCGIGAAMPECTVKACIPAPTLGSEAAAAEAKPRAPRGLIKSRTSARRPERAAAAAMAGLTRWVRPPGPWRPSKLRLLVEAQRSPGASWSAFMPRHIEQPGSRKSKPASRSTTSRPSLMACFLTRPLPGTIMACLMLSAIFLPLTTSATARMSSMRPLVHEPTNTLSIEMSVNFWPASMPMYSMARLNAAASLSFLASLGCGTDPVMGPTISGLVPQVT